MIHKLDDVRQGFDVDCDAVVVGSGAGGAVAAANLAAAGMRTVLLEAGPALEPADMTRDAPLALARYYWEGGLRMVGGSSDFPSMAGRCLGGSTVVNSAIMFELPRWVREIWAQEDDLPFMLGHELDRAYKRVFERSRVAPTPLAVLGRRNLVARDALRAAGMEGAPLPRAVVGCEGCNDCITGCPGGQKQSVDRTYVADAVRDGAEVYSCATATRILTEGSRAVGVEGDIVDPRGFRKVARFRVRADKVLVAAGALNTPALLLRSGITAGRTVGATFFAHIGGGVVGIMDEVTDPWVGATQGWGAFSQQIPGMKLECLWAPPSALMVRWGGVGRAFLELLSDVKYATVIAVVYRGKVSGRVTAKGDGTPRGKLFIPDDQVPIVNRGLRMAADGLLAVGARYVYAGLPGTKEKMRTKADTEAIVNPNLRPRDLSMTLNHVFGSCRMSAHADRGTVDESGAVRGVEGLYLCDASIFPSPSAVNPQGTIMALSDLISRRIGELPV